MIYISLIIWMYLVLRIIKNDHVVFGSDWFAELGFTFFNYHYTAKLIKSSYNLKCLLLKLTYRYLDNQLLMTLILEITGYY